MQLRSRSAEKKGPSILVVDSSHEDLHSLRHMLEEAVPGATINGYIADQQGIPAPNWQDHEIMILDACLSQGNDFDYLRTHDSRGNLPYTVMLSGSYCTCEVHQLNVPGISEHLIKAEVTADVLGAIIDRALKGRLPGQANKDDASLTVTPLRSTAPADNPYAFELPFNDEELLKGDTRIQGYRVHRLIGIGGMSSAYLATRESDNRPVTIKTLKPMLLSDDRVIDRFIKEYQLGKSIRHKNIVGIYDQRFTDEYAYIVMEYLPGTSLKSELRQTLSPRTAVKYALDIASALGALHDAGIVHRDIKPGNFHFNQHNQLVLLDFGISRNVDEDFEITRMGEAIGTPMFMSPEQILENPIDERSDLYALGIIMYRMLTGTYPFSADSAVKLMYNHAYEPAPKLPYKLLGLEKIVDRLLAKDPDDRYQTAEQVYYDLVKFLMMSNRLIGSA